MACAFAAHIRKIQNDFTVSVTHVIWTITHILWIYGSSIYFVSTKKLFSLSFSFLYKWKELQKLREWYVPYF